MSSFYLPLNFIDPSHNSENRENLQRDRTALDLPEESGRETAIVTSGNASNPRHQEEQSQIIGENLPEMAVEIPEEYYKYLPTDENASPSSEESERDTPTVVGERALDVQHRNYHALTPEERDVLFDMNKEKLRMGDPDTLEILKGMALIYVGERNFDSARGFYYMILISQFASLRKGRYDIFSTAKDIASTFKSEKNYVKARGWYEWTLCGQQNLQKDNSALYSTAEEIATILDLEGKCDQASKWRDFALKYWKNISHEGESRRFGPVEIVFKLAERCKDFFN